MIKNFQTQGFTLVELAIVMVIIGLLIGGILKGQELIEEAKARQGIDETVSLVPSYDAGEIVTTVLTGEKAQVLWSNCDYSRIGCFYGVRLPSGLEVEMKDLELKKYVDISE